MTEAEWLACTDDDGSDMQALLAGKGSDRKLRLFAVACCSRLEHLFSDHSLYRAVELAALYADGKADTSDLFPAWERAFQHYEALPDTEYAASNAALAASWCAITREGSGDREEFIASRVALFALWAGDELDERKAQAKLLFDVLGCVDPSPYLKPVWLTSTVLALATGIYDDRAFDQMPILADALQDAGCDNDDILNHCRDEKQVHVRGCWVVDLLLGKS